MFVVIFCIDDDGIMLIVFMLIIMIEIKDVNIWEYDDCVSVNDFDFVLLLSFMMLCEDLVVLRLKLDLGLLISVFLFSWIESILSDFEVFWFLYLKC